MQSHTGRFSDLKKYLPKIDVIWSRKLDSLYK